MNAMIFSPSFILYNCRNLPFWFSLWTSFSFGKYCVISKCECFTYNFNNIYKFVAITCLHGTHWLQFSQWKLLQFHPIHYPFLLPLSIQGPLTDYFPKCPGLTRASGSHSLLLLVQSRTEQLCLTFPLGLYAERGNISAEPNAVIPDVTGEKALRLDDSAGAQWWHVALSLPTTCGVQAMMTFTITLPRSKTPAAPVGRVLMKPLSGTGDSPHLKTWSLFLVPEPLHSHSAHFEHFPWFIMWVVHHTSVSS